MLDTFTDNIIRHMALSGPQIFPHCIIIHYIQQYI